MIKKSPTYLKGVKFSTKYSYSNIMYIKKPIKKILFNVRPRNTSDNFLISKKIGGFCQCLCYVLFFPNC